MKTQKLIVPILLVTALTTAPVMAQGAAQNLSSAVAHSAQAVGHSGVATVQLVSGTVAVPLALSGAVGTASGQAGEALWDVANTPIGEPLPITHENITVGPAPDRAMNR